MDKKFKLIIYFLILILISSLIYQPKIVYADSLNTASDTYSDTVYNVHGNSFNINGVKQSTNPNSITTFGSALPLATIQIDYSKIGPEMGTFNKITNASNIAPGISYDYITDNNGVNKKLAYYDPTKDKNNLIQLYPNMDNVLPGDLFSFIYKDAAILSDGTKANVEIVYSNIHIAIDQRYTGHDSGNDAAYNGKITITEGHNACYNGTDGTRLSSYNSRVTGSTANPVTSTSGINNYPMIGESMDICIKIVDDAGNEVNGTFIFGSYGINLDRSPESGNNMAKPLWYLEDVIQDFGDERETIEVRGGVASDNIYVRPNTKMRPNGETNSGYFYPDIEESNGVIKFIANATNISTTIQNNNTEYTIGKQGNNTQYSTGFITLADASGIKLTCHGHGGYTGVSTNMTTTLFQNAVIDHKITSSSGTGGTIKTTDEGNYNGTLSDGNILSSGTYNIADGKTVTYTITPKTGYWLDTITVDGRDVSLPTAVNGTTTITLDGPSGEERTGTLKNVGNGVYTFEFPANNADHTIHVDWDADHYFIKNWIPEDTTSLTLTAKAYTFNGTSLVYAGASKDVIFTVNKTDENVIEKNTITGGTQWVIKKSDLPIEPEDSIHTSNHDNPYYWFITETVPANYTLKEYDNSSITHTSYYDKSGENTTWQTKAREITTGAYASIVRDGGKITNIMYKDLTVEKIITGNLADTEKEFIYTITVYNGDTAITDNLTINKGGTSTLIDNGGTFTLKHGETATIENIVKGYNYTIVEADTDYAESYKVIKTGDNTVITNTTTGTTITKQVLNEDQTVTYINNKEDIISTGVFNNNLPYIILGTIGLIGILISLLINKKKIT